MPAPAGRRFIVVRTDADGAARYFVGGRGGWSDNPRHAQQYAVRRYAVELAKRYRDGSGSVPTVEEV